MSQFIAPNELHGMSEQELRALRGRIMADLRSMGQSVFLNPNIYASLQNIDAAIQRLRIVAGQRDLRGNGLGYGQAIGLADQHEPGIGT